MDEKMEQKPENVSYVTYETALAREERHSHNWRWFAIWLLIIAVGTNAFWITREMLYEDVVVTENTQDGGGTNIIGGGDISYGAENTNSQD